MIRNFVIDFNYKGIAKHELHIIADFNQDAKTLPGVMLKEYKDRPDKEFELVGITEITGKVFAGVNELEKIVMAPPVDGIRFISWYVDNKAAAKTLWQEPSWKMGYVNSNIKH